MKIKHLLYLWAVSLFIVVVAIQPEIYISDDIRLVWPEQWELGIAQAALFLSLLLCVSSLAAWKGSVFGEKVCMFWGVIYAFITVVISTVYFPDILLESIIFGLAWSFFWWKFTRTFFQIKMQE